MAIQYRKYGDLLKMCMERHYSTFTMEQLGLIARASNDGNQAIEKMLELCKASKTEKDFLKEAQKILFVREEKNGLERFV